jgi:hypothetical protein
LARPAHHKPSGVRGRHDALRSGGRPVDDHPVLQVGMGDLGRRVRKVEAGHAPAAVLAHRERIRQGRLQRERLVYAAHQVDVPRARTERVSGRAERSEDVDDDDRTGLQVRVARRDEARGIGRRAASAAEGSVDPAASGDQRSGLPSTSVVRGALDPEVAAAGLERGSDRNPRST